MVSLSTAFGLCSLIDQQGFLHVSKDVKDCVLVTLGRNIVIRYRLQDQKQLNSWSTIPPLTSKVVYHATKDEYIGIFNENVVKTWKEYDTNLDKVSRIKLKDPGHEVILDEDPVVLFKTGACCKLTDLADRNYEPIKGFLSDESKILSARIIKHDDEKYLTLVALVGEKQAICYSVTLSKDSFKPVLASLKSLKLRRRGHQLLGSCFVSRESGESLATLWSDGFLYSLSLPLTGQPIDVALGQFMGVLRATNLSSPVSLTSLSSHHLAIYGGDPAEEGAVLAVYNLDFGMVQATTTFKLLQKPPRVWAVHGRLIVGLGQRLVCVPYSLQTGSVAALVGTRPPGVDAQTKDIMAVIPTVTWEGAKKNATSSKLSYKSPIPDDVHSQIDTLAAQGSSEAEICDAIITHLMEKQDVEKLNWCLENFVDIPERLTVRLLQFAFTTPGDKFLCGKKVPKNQSKKADKNPCINGDSPKSPDKSRRKSKGAKLNSIEVNGIFPKFDAEETAEMSPIAPPERASFLDRILRVPRNRASLVPALRNGLNITDCTTLLRYFTYLLSAGSAELEQPTIDWCTTIIDAFYQQLVLGRHSQCVESVLTLKEKVEEKILSINELQDLMPIVQRLKNEKGALQNPVQSKSYSIQKFQLYQ